MEEEVKFYLNEASSDMTKALQHLLDELSKLRAGKASPAMVESVRVDYYGTETPISQVANISTTDAKTIIVQPWEKSMLDPISKAIVNANLGFNPSNDGSIIHINVPPPTEERRRDLVKKAKSLGEAGKITVRNIRKDSNDAIKKLQKDGLSEDIAKGAEDQIQKLTDNFIAKIDENLTVKEKEILTV